MVPRKSKDQSGKSPHVRLDFSKLGLFGRKEEQRILRDAYENYEEQIVLISGYSGSGKSSLVKQTFQQVAVENSTLLCRGKFEQYRSSRQPWQGVLDACSALCRQISSSEQHKSDFRDFLQTAGDSDVESQLRLLSNFIPDLAALLQEFPPPSEEANTAIDSSRSGSLNPATDSPRRGSLQPAHGNLLQNSGFWTTRIKASIKTLLKSVSKPSRPVIFFVDDLQWADSASLDLLRAIVSDGSDSRIQALLILAYRDNEVDRVHPFSVVLREIEDSGIRRNLHVKDLDTDALNELISGLTERRPSDTLDLTEVVHRKTNGNPFFSLQFLRVLEQESLLYFSLKSYRWEWSTDEIAAETNLSDNVVDFVVAKLSKLPKKEQDVLQIASCLGSTFDANHVCLFLEEPNKEGVSTSFSENAAFGILEKEDLIVRSMSTSTYRFSHDRIQQGAYSLIEAGPSRDALHLRIGLKLQSDAYSADKEEWADEQLMLLAIDQLNRASSLISESSRRVDLADSNEKAAKIFLGMNAFFPAQTYLEAGVELLVSEGGWDSHEIAMRSMLTDLAGVYSTIGKSEDAISLCKELMSRSKCPADKIRPRILMLECFLLLSQKSNAISFALAALKEVGEPLPLNPSGLRVLCEFLLVNRKRKRLGTEKLLTLPSTKNPEKAGIVDMLTRLLRVAMVENRENLMGLITCRMMNSLLSHGVSFRSSQATGAFGNMVALIQGDFASAYQLGEIGIQLAAGRPEFLHTVPNALCSSVVLTQHLQRPWHEVRERALEAYRLGMEIGDLTASLGGIFGYFCASLWSGLPLHPLFEDAVAYLRVWREYDSMEGVLALSALLEPLCALQDVDSVPEELHDTARERAAVGAYSSGQCLREMVIGYYFRDFDLLSRNREEHWNAFNSHLPTFCDYPVFCLFVGLSELTLFEKTQRRKHKVRSRKMLQQLVHWTKKGNVNCYSMMMLLEAETFRVLKGTSQGYSAVKSTFDKAIVVASKSGFVNHAALANEILGLHILSFHNNDEWGRHYLSKALELYHEWGASKKVKQMLDKHAFLEASMAKFSNSLRTNLRGRSRFDAKVTESHRRTTTME